MTITLANMATAEYGLATRSNSPAPPSPIESAGTHTTFDLISDAASDASSEAHSGWLVFPDPDTISVASARTEHVVSPPEPIGDEDNPTLRPLALALLWILPDTGSSIVKANAHNYPPSHPVKTDLCSGQSSFSDTVSWVLDSEKNPFHAIGELPIELVEYSGMQLEYQSREYGSEVIASGGWRGGWDLEGDRLRLATDRAEVEYWQEGGMDDDDTLDDDALESEWDFGDGEDASSVNNIDGSVGTSTSSAHSTSTDINEDEVRLPFHKYYRNETLGWLHLVKNEKVSVRGLECLEREWDELARELRGPCLDDWAWENVKRVVDFAYTEVARIKHATAILRAFEEECLFVPPHILDQFAAEGGFWSPSSRS
ncbi:hypothetical protein T439DRAFT_345317 [Meredithblackwellia eburnea MCA 4105]